MEEAAYCDEGFFYETGMSSQSSKLVQPTTDVTTTVAPILSVGNSSLVAISTLTSEINFYTRLIKIKFPPNL